MLQCSLDAYFSAVALQEKPTDDEEMNEDGRLALWLPTESLSSYPSRCLIFNILYDMDNSWTARLVLFALFLYLRNVIAWSRLVLSNVALSHTFPGLISFYLSLTSQLRCLLFSILLLPFCCLTWSCLIWFIVSMFVLFSVTKTRLMKVTLTIQRLVRIVIIPVPYTLPYGLDSPYK